MTRAEILSYNTGVEVMASIAAASAHALRAKLIVAPTRYAYAIAALEGIVEAAADLMLPLDGDAAGAVAPVSPAPASGGAAAVAGVA